MQDLLFHPLTQKTVEQITASQPHALLITGEQGAGKTSIARHLAQNALGKVNIATLGQYMEIAPEKGSIGIETVRQLSKFTQLKTPGTATIRRVAGILQYDTMTREAQNAVLKILA